jgi:hypothetical protein
MFSTPDRIAHGLVVEITPLTNSACGLKSSAKPGSYDRYTQSTGPTTTTTLLYL